MAAQRLMSPAASSRRNARRCDSPNDRYNPYFGHASIERGAAQPQRGGRRRDVAHHDATSARSMARTLERIERQVVGFARAPA